MILHIPHASRKIPRPFRPRYLLNDAALELELLRSTDAYTDELFDVPGAQRVVFPVSRLLVDPERFLDDAREPMAKRGRGVVYTHTTEGKPLRINPTPTERQLLLDTWYRPHHRLLADLVDEELVRDGWALVVDCHSFPLKPWPLELKRNPPRPEFCIGTDPFHTPPALASHAVEYLRILGFSVEVNHPYAGSIVPLRHYRNDSGVASIMIEVRRDLYMDEATGARLDSFPAIRRMLSQLLLILPELARSLRNRARIHKHAEQQ